MPQHAKSLLFGASLLLVPLVVLSGCGGGNGGPNPVPTPTQLPGGPPTATPSPTPTQAIVNAVFSNRNADVPATFQTTDGEFTISKNDGPGVNFLALRFGYTGNQMIDVEFYKDGQIKSGDAIPLRNDRPDMSYGVGILSYHDVTKKQWFTAKSGTIKVESLGPDPVNPYRVQVKFSLNNVAMVQGTDRSGTAPTIFTLNATGGATTYPLG